MVDLVSVTGQPLVSRPAAPTVQAGGASMRPDVPLVDVDSDDGGWHEDPEISDEFEPAYWIICETHDIRMDPTIAPDKARATADLGVFTAQFGRWSIYLNWQTRWAQQIPPHHLLVEYNGTPVGIISPFLILRACWKCGRGQPIRDGRFTEDAYWARLQPAMRALHPDWPERIPAVLPAHPCPRCGEHDWWGNSGLIGAHLATREDFQRDAAEEVARLTNTDALAREMAVVHSTTGGPQRYVRTTV